MVKNLRNIYNMHSTAKYALWIFHETILQFGLQKSCKCIKTKYANFQPK